jgi:hypothetical protein
MIRTDQIDWPRAASDLDARGWTVLPALLSSEQCSATTALYDEDARFRSTVVMARHGFGRGEYRYFADPLPDPVPTLRRDLYPPLAQVANRWSERLGRPEIYPTSHRAYRDQCHLAGQARPTPLLLRYGPGDYNCLHQDLYGALHFPLQAAVLLSRPGEDFTGGDFILTEQRPRMQSRVEVVPLAQGDAVIFAVNHRPVEGGRGIYRVTMRHGVSTIRSGQRHMLGIIFHDAT